MDKIGLVTITYNSKKVIEPFLECVWKQTYNNLQLYIVDNASTDSTLYRIKKEKDVRLKVVKNENNFGVAKANNQGIRRAIADGCNQILIINNDVEFEEALIEKLLKIQREKDCSLASPKMMFYNNKDLIWYAGGWFDKCKGYLPLHRGMKQIDEGQFNKLVFNLYQWP